MYLILVLSFQEGYRIEGRSVVPLEPADYPQPERNGLAAH